MRERGGSGGMAESPSTAQIQNQQNQHQQYSALPVTTPSTQDTATNKESSGNGTVDDYMEDICPYATFQLPAVPKSLMERVQIRALFTLDHITQFKVLLSTMIPREQH
nr:uncharacterized protein LOC128686726 isoform X1 [Cherax quadricarinatus]